MNRVVIQGSFDAIAALMAVLKICILEKDTKSALQVASRIPPAISLLLRNPASECVAHLVFARCCQLLLDSLSVEGIKLRLFDFDLCRVAAAAPDSLPLILEPRNPYRRPVDRSYGPQPVPSDAVDWINRHRAPICRLRRAVNSPKWKKGLDPASACARMARAGYAFHESALEDFKRTLGPYWSE
jgi:hypothetical protein